MMNQNKARILVVDDYQVNREVAQLMLRKAGYQVDAVDDGKQAVEAFRQIQYDLILMDIQMPIMDGYEATRKIRNLELEAQGSKLKGTNPAKPSAFSLQPSARAQRKPIIAMTGSAVKGSFPEKQYPGMNDCIAKPLQLGRLLSVVRKWISANPAPPLNNSQVTETGPAVQESEPNQFPLDMDRAIYEFMGKKDILYGVLREFIKKAKIRIETIHQAAKGFDYGVIMAEAHGIKGGAANLTADKIANIAADLEKAGEEQQPDLTAELVDKLAQEFYDLEKYVRQIPELKTINP